MGCGKSPSATELLVGAQSKIERNPLVIRKCVTREGCTLDPFQNYGRNWMLEENRPSCER